MFEKCYPKFLRTYSYCCIVFLKSTFRKHFQNKNDLQNRALHVIEWSDVSDFLPFPICVKRVTCRKHVHDEISIIAYYHLITNWWWWSTFCTFTRSCPKKLQPRVSEFSQTTFFLNISHASFQPMSEVFDWSVKKNDLKIFWVYNKVRFLIGQ